MKVPGSDLTWILTHLQPRNGSFASLVGLGSWHTSYTLVTPYLVERSLHLSTSRACSPLSRFCVSSFHHAGHCVSQVSFRGSEYQYTSTTETHPSSQDDRVVNLRGPGQGDDDYCSERQANAHYKTAERKVKEKKANRLMNSTRPTMLFADAFLVGTRADQSSTTTAFAHCQWKGPGGGRFALSGGRI